MMSQQQRIPKQCLGNAESAEVTIHQRVLEFATHPQNFAENTLKHTYFAQL
jgi:hypothetical protein